MKKDGIQTRNRKMSAKSKRHKKSSSGLNGGAELPGSPGYNKHYSLHGFSGSNFTSPSSLHCNRQLSSYGGPLHSGPLHGGPLHAGPLHGGSLHGGPLHGGSFMSSAVAAVQAFAHHGGDSGYTAGSFGGTMSSGGLVQSGSRLSNEATSGSGGGAGLANGDKYVSSHGGTSFGSLNGGLPTNPVDGIIGAVA